MKEQYYSSDGNEFFITAEKEIEGKSYIIGFLRLRISNNAGFDNDGKEKKLFMPQLYKCALIRELHVVGTAAGIGDEGNVQHKGLGKKLLKKAESISKEHGKNKVVVISGVGVRMYYKKFGYELQGCYMCKDI